MPISLVFRCFLMTSLFFISTLRSALVSSLEYDAINDITEGRDYCLHESFNATCPPGAVVLMTAAIYGRMRLGRCINGDFNIGCSNDVISYFDSQCTAKRQCEVSVRNLVDIHPCQRDFMSYLEAKFTCIKVSSPKLTSCTVDRHAAIPVDSSSGHLVYGQRTVTSSTFADNLGPTAAQSPPLTRPTAGFSLQDTSAAGTKSCPWILTARRGQRIKLRIVVAVEVDVSSGSGAPPFFDDSVATSGNLQCAEMVVIDEKDDFSTGAGSNSPASRVELPICSGRQRERLLYMSVGHMVSVHVELGRNQVLAPPTMAASASAMEIVTQHTRFILNYESTGCPDIVVPHNAWLKRTGDNVMIRCNDSMETWYLSCQGNRWIGDITNCSHKGFQANKDEEGKPRQTIIPAQGLVLAVLLGIAFGIFIGLILLLALHCARRRANAIESSKRKAAMLMVPSGAQGQGQAIVGGQLDDDDVPGQLQPATVTRLYHPNPYSTTYHTSTLNVSSGGAVLTPGEYGDNYCSPHYGYHHITPSSAAVTYLTSSYCRTHSTDTGGLSCSTCATTAPYSQTGSSNSSVNVLDNESSGLSTILSTGNDNKTYEVRVPFYPPGMRTPGDKAVLFPVGTSTGTTTSVRRSPPGGCDLNCTDSCLTCRPGTQLRSQLI